MDTTKTELSVEISDDLLREMEEILSSRLSEHGFKVEAGSSASGSPDLVIRDEGGNAVSILEFKAPSDERLERAQDLLHEVRERNQTIEQRLERLRQRLAIA